MSSLAPSFTSRGLQLAAAFATPAMIIFVSSNVVNVGNLAFNMIFSRWMGPDMFGDLAFVLTVKLSLLGLLGALGSAVSQKVANEAVFDAAHTNQVLARINQVAFVALWMLLPVIALGLLGSAIDARLGLASPMLLLILLGSVPFCAPLNILRGVALGRMATSKIVLSANVEMAVRLGLAIAAWQAGLGLEGVVAAIVLSIVAGWAVLRDLVPTPARLPVSDVRPVATALGLAALPFAMLQLGQIAALDGDIFLATRFLDDMHTGYVAALTLFQRIQFFACFALAGVLLPSVIIAVRNGTSYRSSVLTIGALLATVSAIVMAAAAFLPETLIGMLVGKDYVAAAPLLLTVCAAASVFTLNYLIATFLMARGSAVGIVVVVSGSLLQLVLMGVCVAADTGDLAPMFTTKLLCQLGILSLLGACLLTQPRR